MLEAAYYHERDVENMRDIYVLVYFVYTMEVWACSELLFHLVCLNRLLISCYTKADTVKQLQNSNVVVHPHIISTSQPCMVSQQTRQVTHDIPVTVIPRKLWSDYQEPRIPDPDVSYCNNPIFLSQEPGRVYGTPQGRPLYVF